VGLFGGSTGGGFVSKNQSRTGGALASASFSTRGTRVVKTNGEKTKKKNGGASHPWIGVWPRWPGTHPACRGPGKPTKRTVGPRPGGSCLGKNPEMRHKKKTWCARFISPAGGGEGSSAENPSPSFGGKPEIFEIPVHPEKKRGKKKAGPGFRKAAR